jgi:exodeoxyribonuclease VII large subunit
LTQQLETLRQGFGDNAARLEVLSPLKTLARGYAVVTHGSGGKVVADAASLTVGEQLLLRLHAGQASCRVESCEIVKLDV